MRIHLSKYYVSISIKLSRILGNIYDIYNNDDFNSYKIILMRFKNCCKFNHFTKKKIIIKYTIMLEDRHWINMHEFILIKFRDDLQILTII